MLKRHLRASAASSLVLALAACTGGGAPARDDVAPMWAAEIDRILADSPSDLEKRALADGKISDGEMSEARNAFKSCIEDLPYGFDVEILPDGGFDIGPLDKFYDSFSSEEEGRAAYQALVDDCETGTTGALGMLHAAMRDNPQGKTSVQLIRECFDEHDVKDGAGLTDDAFKDLLESPDYTPSTAWAQSCFIDPESDVLMEEPMEPLQQDTE